MYWLALQPQPDDATPPRAGNPSDDAGPAALTDAHAALGWWALQFTPRVVCLEQAVLLEVSASERLFGGRQQLVDRILGAPRPVPSVRMAQAATALLALAQLQLAPDAYRGPDPLPLATLAEARPHLATLERIGCRSWGDLRALPRGGVARRFGAPLLDALDRAYGLRPEVYPWLVLPEVFDAPLELLAQVEAAPALLFAARRLLAQLHVWLQARRKGVLALELAWQMDARRNTATVGRLLVRTATPTLDMAHMQRLLAEHLARVTLAAPALSLRLRSVETADLPGVSASLLPDELRSGDDLQQLLERLSARLGPQQVLRVLPHADHRPECMQVWVAATPQERSVRAPRSSQRQAAAPGTAAASDALYPTWLLERPLKLAVRRDRPLYQGPLTLLVGPQRLEAAWWDVVPPTAAAASVDSRPVARAATGAQAGDRLALRDYFLARSEQAGLLWIYRERLVTGAPGADRAASHWYLQGLFG